MSFQESLSRRRFVKTAAEGATLAFIPFLGKRGPVTAQEDQPTQIPETAIAIPESHTLEDRIRGFTALLTENMKPEALEYLGLAPILTQEELKKKHEEGTFVVEKSVGQFRQSNIDLTVMNYLLLPPDAVPTQGTIFSAFYIYEEAKPSALWQQVAFSVGSDGKLLHQKKEKDIPGPSDDLLRQFAETYFKLPDTMGWEMWPDIGPEWMKDIAITGHGKEEKNGLVKEYRLAFNNGSSGTIDFTAVTTEPTPI